MELFSVILILIMTVSLSGVINQVLVFNFPVPLIQLSLGILLAALGVQLNLEPEIFILLFIPPLLFTDGRKTQITDFIHSHREILNLALVLVFLTILCIGSLLYYLLPHISLPAAFALAAVLAPTDAIALNGVVGNGRIAKTKLEILEGESLMNDASGLVTLKFAVLIAMGALHFDLLKISVSFLTTAISGVIIGFIITWLYCKMLLFINRLTNDDPTIQILLLLLLPFIVYIFGEQMNASGIFAVVSAGMTVRQAPMMYQVPLTMRLQSNNAWSVLAFTFNGIVFILLGLQLPHILGNTLHNVSRDPDTSFSLLCMIVVAVYAFIMIMRFLWLFTMKKINQLIPRKYGLSFSTYSLNDLLVATFAGVRGAITFAGILSIPVAISGRYELIFIAAGIVIMSIVIASIILPVLLRGRQHANNSQLRKEEAYARQKISEEAIYTLENTQSHLKGNLEDIDDIVDFDEVCTRVIGYFHNKLTHAAEENNLERSLYLIGLGAERTKLYQLRAKNIISDETLDKLLYELDVKETVLSNDP